VPKPELTRTISGAFFERLMAELGRRYRYVFLDVGADIRGSELAVHRTALALASQVLLVASADLVGLWHARVALNLLRSQLPLDSDRLHLVINRYDRRFHHSRTEIAWALGTPTAALIPYDHQRVQRALLAQRPLVDDSRGSARRALLDLAERIQAGTIASPPEQEDASESGWMRRFSRIPLVKRGRRDRTSPAPEQEGGTRDDHPATARAE
jgi:MinD-like ATPase involved in chromosome partitioning or flagellar assembly